LDMATSTLNFIHPTGGGPSRFHCLRGPPLFSLLVPTCPCASQIWIFQWNCESVAASGKIAYVLSSFSHTIGLMSTASQISHNDMPKK
jgi:hypothetical protein